MKDWKDILYDKITQTTNNNNKMQELQWDEKSTEDLTQTMFDFITDYVRDSDARTDMLDILNELENRID